MGSWGDKDVSHIKANYLNCKAQKKGRDSQEFFDDMVERNFHELSKAERNAFLRNIDFYKKRDKPLVDEFCRKYDTGIGKIDYTTENGKVEPMYYFTDGLGGYTRKGLENSL